MDTYHPHKAIVLLSGGLDSATALALAVRNSDSALALIFHYGQRHALETQAACTLAEAHGVARRIIGIDLRQFGGSALTSSEIEVPKGSTGASAGSTATGAGSGSASEGAELEIPITYVPARNTIFLSYALALAETEQADAIYIGVNSLDYSGYPDCRPEFVRAFQLLANLATKRAVEGAPVKILTPLIEMTKAEIITLGAKLGVDYSLTISCYDPDPTGAACGECDSCRLRKKGFREAGVSDPTRYVTASGRGES
ncbi:MAG: 7-cyano-7-deazaguanine synthase QueC [Candidatus Zixiibacteriota bacterium]